MPPSEVIHVRARHLNALVKTTSLQFSPATPGRNYLYIQATGLQPIYIRFGETNHASASVGANGDMVITAGNDHEWLVAVPNNSINIISPGGATTATIIEGLPAVGGNTR